MIERAFTVVMLIAFVGCTMASFSDRPECPEEVMAEWQIPDAWYVHRRPTVSLPSRAARPSPPASARIWMITQRPRWPVGCVGCTDTASGL